MAASAQQIVASPVQPMCVQPQLQELPGMSAMQQSLYTMTFCIAKHAEQDKAIWLSSALYKQSCTPCPYWRLVVHAIWKGR